MVDNVYNVGHDTMNFSKQEVCQMIVDKTGAFVHFEEIGEDADKRNYIVSYDKIGNLGFKTEITLEEGVDEIIEVIKVMDFQDTYSNAKYI